MLHLRIQGTCCLQCFDTVGRPEGHPACKKMGWWRWALVSPDGVAPSRIVGVSASVNLPLHHKVQNFSSGTGLPGWSRKKGHKTVVLVVVNSGYFISKFFYRIMYKQLRVRNAILNSTYIRPSKNAVRTFALRHKNKTPCSSFP